MPPSTFALSQSNSDDRPEVAFWSEMAAEQHEHTLTALWDHEAERKGAVGQGPGWLQAIRTAQPRRWQDGHTVTMETQAVQAKYGNWYLSNRKRQTIEGDEIG